jgi:hypothetical protein
MTTPVLPIRRIVLYKHGVGHFEREGHVEGDATIALTFKQSEVSDVLKSLTVLDLDDGHIASVSYDSTKPLNQLLGEVALSIPDRGSLVGLLPQIKGARLAVQPAGKRVEGVLIGVDVKQRHTADGVERVVLVSLLTDDGLVRSFDLHALEGLEVLDPGLRRDLDYYLRTVLSAKKKDAKTFTFFARGEGKRGVRVSYTVEAPVWKATYRILLGEESRHPTIQGWAVVDNTQDEDWEDVQLALIAGLPVSFVHDLYTPRYITRPVVEVKETTGVLPPVVEEGVPVAAADEDEEFALEMEAVGGAARKMRRRVRGSALALEAPRSAASSMPAQVRERKLGDLFEYEIEHPVTIRRNQSALVPIVLRAFEGRPVLLHNSRTRRENPMRCVELKNTTGLTLEGGPVTVLEGGSYVGEAMLETLKPDEQRLVPYAVELSVKVLDNVKTRTEDVSGFVLKNGQLTRFSRRVQQTTYHLDNRSEVEHTCYLDHPRDDSGWELFDTPGAVETTDNFWRFRFALPAKKVTKFVVRARFPQRLTQALTSIAGNELTLWLEQKHIDAATAKAVREAMAAQARVAELEAVLAKLNQERETIHKDQGRIRENMQALGDRSSERELRERFVRTLAAQEDRLLAIQTEIEERTRERDQAREWLRQLLAAMEFEG